MPPLSELGRKPRTSPPRTSTSPRGSRRRRRGSSSTTPTSSSAGHATGSPNSKPTTTAGATPTPSPTATRCNWRTAAGTSTAPRGEYRGGSFKGLDLAFGDGAAYFGILIRTVVAAGRHRSSTAPRSRSITCWPRRSGERRGLDGVINGAVALGRDLAAVLVEAEKPRTARGVRSSSRVGLSLKKAKGKPDARGSSRGRTAT